MDRVFRNLPLVLAMEIARAQVKYAMPWLHLTYEFCGMIRLNGQKTVQLRSDLPLL